MQRLLLAVALLGSIYVCTVRGGAAYEVEQPLFGNDPNDFKITTWTPDFEPSTPVGIFTGQTPFNKTSPQVKRAAFAPCGIVAAHTHPRGTEFGYTISGSFEFGISTENGTYVTVETKPGEGVVLPQGAVHYVRNTACGPSELVVFFDDPNPGTLFTAQALGSLPQDYLTSAVSCGAGFKATNTSFLAAKCTC